MSSNIIMTRNKSKYLNKYSKYHTDSFNIMCSIVTYENSNKFYFMTKEIPVSDVVYIVRNVVEYNFPVQKYIPSILNYLFRFIQCDFNSFLTYFTNFSKCNEQHILQFIRQQDNNVSRQGILRILQEIDYELISEINYLEENQLQELINKFMFVLYQYNNGMSGVYPSHNLKERIMRRLATSISIMMLSKN